ncbi:MAG TPA: PilN domain-containing protein [Thermodesulfovibrionia bacterium]|nr:PilN domain-containing protein [Thermodesulfovibrionia bacterium]
MIRVNLLPEGKKKKKRPFPLILFVGIVVTVITLSIFGAYTAYLSKKIKAMNDEFNQKTRQLQKLKEMIKEVENFEAENKLLADKNNIIMQLKKSQNGPVKVLDELSSKLPDEQDSTQKAGMWFTSILDKAGTISLQGVAFSNTTLVNYVQSLKASENIINVNLVESKQAEIENVTIYNFTITFQVKV